MSTDKQPNSPAEWKEYASLKALTEIPATADETRDVDEEAEEYRNIYLDGSAIIQHPLGYCEIYTDVLAFEGTGELILSFGKDTTVEINARVITADQPVHLNMTKSGAQSSAITIYTAVVDQPITVSIEGAQRTTLLVGADSGNLGVELGFDDGQLSILYVTEHDYDVSSDYQAFLDTELRLALALFWSRPNIAISICAFVATSTYKAGEHSVSNAQAVSLGQQLAAHVLAGPNASYAPVLSFEKYHDNMRDQLDAAKTFEEQYQRFQDKKALEADGLAAWTTMLEIAQGQRSSRLSVQENTFTKYSDACTATKACASQLNDDNEELRHAKDAFQDGLVKWKKAQTLKAAFGILTAIFEFAFSIAGICIDANPAGAAEGVEGAIDSVKKAEEEANNVGRIITSGALQKLWDFTQILETLYPKVDTLVDAVKALGDLSSGDAADIPSFKDISGAAGSDADASLITSLAAWDEWELECDQQMEWAADEERIEGASEYRLALRKHAVHGRAVAQAQAEAIKQGQQYVQATLQVLQSDQDIRDLQDLLENYSEEDEQYAAAQAKFYDHFLRLRTSLAIQLQYIIDAYRFYALQDSQVMLDSQKSVGDFQQDLATLVIEMQNTESQHAAGFTSFDYIVYSDELASNYPELVINGLKDNSQRNKTTFTMVATPQAKLAPDVNNYAYPFCEGSHYRLDGLEILLSNVKPKPEAVRGHGTAVVSFKIETSGSYSDIQGDQVHYFVSQAQQQRYSYLIDADGSFQSTRDRVIFDSSNHTEPPPFTQWTITLETPEVLELSTLDSLQIHWNGKYRAF